MIEGLEAVGFSVVTVVEVDADEDRVLLAIRYAGTVVERDEHIGAAGSDRLETVVAQLPVESPHHVQGETFFHQPLAGGSVVVSAVTGVEDDGGEGATGPAHAGDADGFTCGEREESEEEEGGEREGAALIHLGAEIGVRMDRRSVGDKMKR